MANEFGTLQSGLLSLIFFSVKRMKPALPYRSKILYRVCLQENCLKAIINCRERKNIFFFAKLNIYLNNPG